MRVLSIVWTLLAACAGAAAETPAPPFAFAGAVDLSGWRFQRDGPVALIGDWALYPDTLVQPLDVTGEGSGAQPIFAPVPSGWQDISEQDIGVSLGPRGAATYVLTITLPSVRDGLGLKIPPLPAAARVFVDGEELALQGQPALDAASERIDLRPRVVPLPATMDDDVQLLVQVSNFSLSRGGIFQAFELGPITDLFEATESKRRLGLLFIGGLAALALYYSSVYAFRRNEAEYGLLAILSGVTALRAGLASGVFAALFDSVAYDWLLRLDHVTLYVLPWLAYVLFAQLYPRDTSAIVVHLAGVVALAGAGMVLITPPHVFTLMAPVIAAQMVFCGSAALLALWQAVRCGRAGARLALAALITAAVTGLHSAMVTTGQLPSAPDLSPLALLLLFGVQAAIFHERTSGQSAAMGAMAAELDQTHSKIEAAVAERTEALNDAVRSLKAQQQELQESNAALTRASGEKDRFFTVIAHDLRTPFNALLGFADLMEQRADDLDAEGVRYYAAEIQLAGRAVLGLLDNLLQWARVQMGQMRFNPQPRDLPQIVDAALESIGPVARAKGVTVSTEVRSQLVYVDFDMLLIVIRNLLSNAVKFSERSGHIRISSHDAEGMAVLTVADNGIGMTPDALSRIFSPDGAIVRAGTNGEQGTGLGLLLCRDLIDKHGGEIAVDSREGRGTTITVTLPTRMPQPIS